MRKCFLLSAFCTFSAISAVKAAEIDAIQQPDGYTTIVLRGEILPGDDRRFYEIARMAPKASVALESPGGNLDAGLAIAAEVAIRDYATLVLEGDGCFSACALIWVAANRRYMAPKAVIGVHSAYALIEIENGVIEARPTGMGNADIGAFLNQIGLDRVAIQYFTAAGPNEFLPITPEIARRLNIDVRVQDGFEITYETERPTPRRISARATRLIQYSRTCQKPLSLSTGPIAIHAQTIIDGAAAEFGQDIFPQLNLEYFDSYIGEIERMGTFQWCLDTYERLIEMNEMTGVLGPSFDCGGALTDSELTICNSPLLWGYDRVTADIYGYLRRNLDAKQAAQLRADQASWLARRQRCATSIKCNLDTYVARIQELGG